MLVLAIVSEGWIYHRLPLLLLYLGPDVFLPLTSALAAVLGALLLFWSRTLALMFAAWRFVFRSRRESEPDRLETEGNKRPLP